MNDKLQARVLEAVNRAMFYCLKVYKGEHCVVRLGGEDRPVPVNELYETIMHLRAMVLSKDEARMLKRIVEDEQSYAKNNAITSSKADHSAAAGFEKFAARLQPILDKLEVLIGQA